MKRFPLILGFICLILFSCDKSPQEEFVPLESVRIVPAEAALTVGGSLQLEAQITPSNATYQKTSWTTSKPTVAKVSETGLVTAVSAGRATITVSAGGKKASCAISVSEQIVIVEVTSVTIDRENLDLNKGESVQLTAVVKPDNARDKEVSWTSSNAGVAAVAQDGTVAAVGAGSATITAEASGKTDDCVVTVTVPVQGISLDRDKATIFEEDELFLTATVSPDDASDPSVSWNSSDTDVATVSEGTVKAVGIGTAVITAKAGEQAATCVVTVSKRTVHVTSIALDKTNLSLTVGDAATLVATVLPQDAADRSVIWESTNHSIATVDAEGNVSAISAGAVTITATTADGGLLAGCEVTISPQEIPVVHVSSITLDNTSYNLEIGESFMLSASVLPENANESTFSWSSSDTGVAIVDSDGRVTAIAAGTAIITATTNEGGLTADCEVTVSVHYVAVSSIILNKISLSLAEGERECLIATVLPGDATDASVTWVSGNTRVATVENGLVSAVEPGMAIITARAGGRETACEVTVRRVAVHVTSISLDRTNLHLSVGESERLLALVLPEEADNRTVIWYTTTPAVAKVDAYGNVTAVSSGAVTVTATTLDGGLISGCEVTVTASDVPGPPDPPEPQVIHVTSIALDKTSCELEVGASLVLNSDVLPEDADDKSCGWSSSNSGIAAVDSDGKVTAITAGTATITATTTDGQLTASCTVTVFAPEIPVVHVSSIALDRTSLNLAVGEYATLKATVLPENAEDRSFNWRSSNQSIARIDADGRVSALSAGTVTITATTTDGGLTAACEVTVYTPYIEVTSVTLNKYSLNFIEGESETLTATVMPVNATDKSIVWSSSNTQVATVDNGLVTAVKEGSATITAAAGGKTATCTVTVSAPEVPPVIPPDPEDHPYTSNVTWTLGSRAYDHTTGGEYDPQSAVVNGVQVEKIVKLGTSGSNGDFIVNIPAGTTYIGFFALGWKGSTPQLTLTCNGTPRTYDIKSNSGVASTPPYTISTTEEDAYFTFDITGSTPTTVKFQSAGRVVVWGINAYNGENPNPGGGDTPGGDTPGGDTPGGGGDPVFAGWMELPATDDSNLYFVAHKSTANASGRNYSYYWDADALVARWVAYPLNPDIIGTGTRTDKWAEDNALPNGVAQPILKKAFNPSSYSRGHQIASADRLRYADNVQTFYYTNMTPQESKFNGGVWNSVEQKVRSWSGKFDTLYVVTGCVVEGSTKYAFDNSGKRVKVPMGYYKALLGYDKSQKKGITSQTGGYTGIAFYFDHFGSYTSSAYMNQSMTIDALEELVGVDFFVNLPAAVGEEKANKAESTRDTWWNNN